MSLAPLACSYMLMACRIVVKVVGSVIKTVTSSAYARTVVFKCRRPIFMLGSDSSRDRTRGCRHRSYRHILSGHPCLFPLWMAVGPRRVPFICTDALILLYITCSLSTKHGLISYRRSTWNRYSCDTRSGACRKSNDNRQSGVRVDSWYVMTSRTVASASSIERPGIPEFWPILREWVSDDGP